MPPLVTYNMTSPRRPHYRSRHLTTVRYSDSRHVHIRRLRMRSLALFLRCCWQILTEESVKHILKIRKG